MKYWILTAVMFAISGLLYYASGETLSEALLWLSGAFGGVGFLVLAAGIGAIND